MSARRNILLISLDDAVAFWRYKSVFGQALQTPNLDRICAQSTSFQAAYCQSPICGPSRASFMSGRTPHQLGVFHNRDKVFDSVHPQEMWPFRLKQAGYFCSSGGKVHHGYKPLKPYAHGVLYSDKRKGFRIDRKLAAHVPQKRYGGHAGGLATTDPKDDGYYHDAHAVESFQSFIDSYDKDQPFYREVGFFGPHGPFITPARYKDVYDPKAFKQPDAWAQGYDQNPFAAQYMRENFATHNVKHWRQSVRNYFSAYSHVDHHLGRVWDALKASPHAGNTVVVILADHGFHVGEKNRFRKTSLWEQVAGVPLIVHDPTRPEAQAIHDPVALLDVGPTVLDYAGLPPPEGCIGQTLRPVVDGAGAPERAIPTFHYDSVGVRKGRYRLIRYADGSTQFYDVENDWWNLHDLGDTHPDFGAMYTCLSKTALDYGLDINAGTPRYSS